MKKLGKKMDSVKKLAEKVKVIGAGGRKLSSYECIESDNEESSSSTTHTTPRGYVAVYVGEERQRFVVRTSFLSHPLFRMLLEKAKKEFGYEQTNGLVVPCSVSAFEEVVRAVESSQGQFDLGNYIEEFI